MKYAVFDESGIPVAFYDPVVHAEIPAEAIEITEAQWQELIDHAGLRRWDGAQVVAYEPEPAEPQIPARVSSRQFRLQLLALGLLDAVDAWVESQPRAIQIAYESSATFERSDTMMQAGFDALGFEPAQVDAFFTAAAEL